MSISQPIRSRPEQPTALITGGAVRVGRAITDALLHHGYKVWVHHFTSRDAAEQLKRNPGVLGVLQADLRDLNQRQRMLENVRQEGGLDLIVNNAASFESGSFSRRTDDDLRRVLELNLIAPISIVRGLIDVMSPSGSVINLVDLGAHHPWMHRLDHCVAKAGLEMATRALALELAPIRVNAVSPGTVSLPVGLDHEAEQRLIARTPRGTLGTGDDVAEAILYLASAPHVSGQTLVIDGGRLAGIAGHHA